MHHNIPLITIVLSIVIGALAGAFAEKTKTPAILYYFAGGLLFGKFGFDIIRPDSLGVGLNIIINLFVSIILFEGGLSLNIFRLRQINKVLTRQILMSLFIGLPLSFVIVKYILNLSTEVSLIFASLSIVTGPTVIKPIIRHIPLRNRVKTFLNGEAVIIDAVGAVVSILLLEYILSKQYIQNAIAGFILSISAGIIIGIIFGFVVRYLLNQTSFIPESIKRNFLFGTIFLNYFISELIASESGLLSVAVYGIVLSAITHKEKNKLLTFNEDITRIIISILFILLSARFDAESLPGIFRQGSLVVIFLIIIRFPMVYLSAFKSEFSFGEKIFMGWIGTRGIIALSVVSIAGLKMKNAGIENTQGMEILILMLISGTIILQGFTANFAARKLKILAHGDRNIILLGVNDISLSIAEVWKKHKNKVLFVDSNKNNCTIAHERGFQYVCGNGLISETYSTLDMGNYSSALAITANNEINILFCRHMGELFGIANLYSALAQSADHRLTEVIEENNIKTIKMFDKAKKSTGIFNSLIGFFNKMKYITGTVIVKNDKFLHLSPAEYSFPDDTLVLCVVRKNNICYIFHSEFKLEYNDEILVISSNKNLKLLEESIET